MTSPKLPSSARGKSSSSLMKLMRNLHPYWFQALGLMVIVQQSAYWGYRMGQDHCLDCVSSPRQGERGLSPNNDNAVKRGIVLTSQCSGSEWIVSSLNNVPGVTWHLERMIGYSKTYMKDPEWEQVTWDTYQKEMEQAFSIPPSNYKHMSEVTPPGPDKPILIGFKLMYDQIPQQLRLRFAQWLEENQIFVVHLRRKCAALQFASQMDKWMHKIRNQNKKDHVYSKAEAEALAQRKDWQITLQDRPGAATNRWLESIRLLEENQQEFANFLHIYAAQAPVFEFTYESVDGPHQANWFNALYAFLGLDAKYTNQRSKTIKTGKRTCEDRMVGLGGPALSTLQETPQSRVECLRMRGLAAGANNHTTSVSALQSLALQQQLLVPPHDGRCRLGPNCRQREYGRFQDELKKRQQQKP